MKDRFRYCSKLFILINALDFDATQAAALNVNNNIAGTSDLDINSFSTNISVGDYGSIVGANFIHWLFDIRNNSCLALTALPIRNSQTGGM